MDNSYLCVTCAHYPPSSFGGKPCCICDTGDPLVDCYQPANNTHPEQGGEEGDEDVEG